MNTPTHDKVNELIERVRFICVKGGVRPEIMGALCHAIRYDDSNAAPREITAEASSPVLGEFVEVPQSEGTHTHPVPTREANAARGAAPVVIPSAERAQEGYPGIAHDFETIRSALVQIRDECFNGHAHDIAEAALNAAPQRSTAKDSTGPSQEGLGQGDAAVAAPPSSERERIEAALRACDGLSTLDLTGNKRGWLAELCYDAYKLDEPYKAGAQKCLEIVKEMRAAIVHQDGVDYGILSRIEYRLQKVVDKPVAPPPVVTPSASAPSNAQNGGSTKGATMTRDEMLLVIRIVLELSKAHWVTNGTPIKPEDAELVAQDVENAVIVRRAEGAAK